MQKLGQHFLKNQTAIRNIVAALEIKPGDTIIEIGPGKGALTVPLLRECELRGAKLVAIERDRALAKSLGENVQLPKANFRIIAEDAIKILPQLIGDLDIGRWKLAGNIPYYITGKLLRVLSELAQKPTRTVLMIQKEVAQRLCAKEPEMNLLAAAVQFWAEPKMLFSLPPSDFTPPPKVDSAVVCLKTHRLINSLTASESATYYRLIRTVFKQPRKTLGNNLSAGFPRLSRDTIEKNLNKIGLKSSLRGQNLSLENLVALAQLF